MWSNANVQSAHFMTPEFWQELRQRALQAFDEQTESYGFSATA